MRIVVDTNTVVSGLLWQGPPRRLIDAARERALTLCTSLALVAELAEVIGRAKFAQRARTAGVSAAALVEDYQRLAQLIDAPPLATPVSRDPDDDQVLACAVAAHADYIVSGDQDLLSLKRYQNIDIVAPARALQLIGAG